MAAPSKQFDFTNGTDADADEVNVNFDDLYTWAQQDAIDRDGSVAFNAVPTGPSTDPSSDDHLVRKAYADKKAGGMVVAPKEKTGGAADVLVANDMAETWTAVAAFNTTVAEKDGHWYRCKIHFPSIFTNKNGVLSTIQTRVACRIKRAGTEIGRGIVGHDVADNGSSLTVEAYVHATSDSSKAYTVEFTHYYGTDSTPGNAVIKYTAFPSYPAFFAIEDLGTGV